MRRDIRQFDPLRFCIWFASLAMGMASVRRYLRHHPALCRIVRFMKWNSGQQGKTPTFKLIEGRSAFTLSRDCDGWLSGEDYVIEFGGREGNLDRIVSRFSSWEADAGDKYSFDITETSSYQDNQEFNGYATITADRSDAYFSMSPEAPVSLPQDTYFPMRHMMAILDYARSGKKDIGSDSVYWR